MAAATDRMEWDDLPESGIEDMITLRNLSEQSLLLNLKKRYTKNLIYTYTGSILVSVNPFKQLPIYTQAIVNQYLGQRMGTMPPHVFATADSAYYHMQEDKKNQSVIISGESGAGKTEATKLILQYLAAMTSEHSEVEQQILESSPILESFGNARTVRNNNSSRFGKFMQISFSSTGSITGAKITQYLLEKSRIVWQATGERNYHIFYQLVLGADNEEKKTYMVQEPNAYHYINQSGIIQIPGGKVDDSEDFQRTKMALSFLKLDETKQKEIFRVLGGILQLGNVEFAPGPHDSSEIKNIAVLSNVAKLFEVDEEKLKQGLVKRTMVVTNQTLTLTLKPEQAEESRDALSKTLYSRLFSWLVDMINIVICKESANATFIGILDIFGFENFKVNSFEQVCINYANEKLQQHFNHHIFKLEQEEYDKEKINWSKIPFKDNQETIDLIEQIKPKPGVIALLDEQCRFPKASDKTFLDQLLSNFEGKHGNFDKNKRVQNQFIIKHYAGDVSYTITGFLDKNRDTLFVDLLSTMNTSKLNTIKTLFKEVQSDADASTGGAKKQVRSVAGFFRSQLGELTNILSSTFGHYVRCVKPNMAQAPDNFDEDMVLAQLRYAGMMETIKIRRNGYPIRYPHDEFWKRYRMLVPAVALSGTNYRKACDDMLPKVQSEDPDDWQNGTTKVFLRERMYALLEDKRSYLLSFSAIKCQAFWRMAMVRGYFCEKRDACRVLQKEMKAYLARNHWTKAREGSILFQSVARMLKIRAKYRADVHKKREEERKKKEEAERKRKEEEARIRKMAEEFKKTHSNDPRSVDEIMKDLLTKSEEERAEEEARRRKVAEMKLLEEEEKEREKREKEEAAKAPKEEPPKPKVEAPEKKGVNIRIDDLKPDSKRKGSSILKKQQMKQPSKDPPKYAKRLPKKAKNEVPEPGDLPSEDLPFEKFPGLKKAEKKKKKMGKIFSKKKKDEFGFSAEPLEGPLLSLTPEGQKMAVEVSGSILAYQMRKSSTLDASELNTVQGIIKYGMQHEEMRDEIYAQLVKQSNVLDKRKVKDADAVVKCAWELMSACVISFPPSPELLPYFVNFLKVSHTNVFAKFCLKRLRRGLHTGGKFRHMYKRTAPSTKELQAVIQQQNLVVKVMPQLLNEDKVIQVEIDNATTASEALSLAGAHPDLQIWDYAELALYEDTGGLVFHPLNDDDLLVDAVARLEKKNKSADLVLQMKRRLWLPPYYIVPISEDKAFASISAKQLMASFNDGNLPIVDPENALIMAALKLKILDTQKIDFKELLPAAMLKTKTLNDEETWKKTIKSKLNSFQNLKPYNLHKTIIQTAKESPLYGFTIFKTEHNAPKFKFNSPFEIAVGRAGVQFIRENDKSLICSFSYAEFSIKECRDEIFTVNINIEGQELLTERFKSIRAVELCNLVMDYSLRRLRECEFAVAIADYTPDDPTFMHFSKDDIIYILDKDDEKGWYSGQCGVRSGPFPKDLISVKIDVPVDAGARFDRGRVSLKNRLDTLGLEGVDQGESMTYKQKLQIKRNTIIKSNRGPGTATGNAAGAGGGRFARKSMWRGTMITPVPEMILKDEEAFIEYADKYFRHRPFEKEDDPDAIEQEGKEKKEKKEKKGKRDDYSSVKRTTYSKSAIKDSLLNIKDAKTNKEAVKMFQDVMKFMGDYPTTSPSVEVAQRVVQKALEYGEELQDELYCQLMKQTTENSNQDSKFHGWELILLAVSVFLPSEKLSPYVMAHLWLGSKESNATIALFANECIQRLERTQLKGPRALAPSLREVEIITMGGGQFQVDVFLTHGEKVAVEIDSASTVKDVIDRVLRVSNLDVNPDSWTLFEEVRSLKDGNKSDVGISGSIKIGDILARWEKLGAAFLCRLVFKKWVYHDDENIDFDNPFLLPYLSYQAQLQVSSGLYPLFSDDEAYELASYYLEVEIGKYSDNNWKSKVVRPWHKERDNKEASLSGSVQREKDAPPIQLPADILMLTSIVDVILPPGMKTTEKKVSEALKAIEKKWQEHGELNLKKVQAAALHLGLLRKSKYFGAAQFSVTYKVDKNTTINGTLFISNKGLSVYDAASVTSNPQAQPVKTWEYLGISSYSATSSAFTVITGNLSSPIREVFNTKFAQSIQTIFTKYSSKAKVQGKPQLSKTKTVARFKRY